jgi:RNA polymerase sigma-70 factor, ECF subfamily
VGDSSADASSPSLAGADLRELERLRSGGQEAVAELYSSYRERLGRMVRFRMDPRLSGRVDPEDILQEAYMEIARRIQDYLDEPTVPLFVWLRQITWQILVDTHRRHLVAKARNVNAEVNRLPPDVGMTSVSLAARLVGGLTSPSQAILREERLVQVRDALDEMDEIDREVLALRHFEQLTNNEVAEVLGLQKAAASNRYVRALGRLKQILDRVMRDD